MYGMLEAIVVIKNLTRVTRSSIGNSACKTIFHVFILVYYGERYIVFHVYGIKGKLLKDEYMKKVKDAT